MIRVVEARADSGLGADCKNREALPHCLKHVFQPRRIAQCDHTTITVRIERIALPVAHQPARAFDHRHQRSEVIKLEVGFYHQVDMAARDQRIIVAISYNFV